MRKNVIFSAAITLLLLGCSESNLDELDVRLDEQISMENKFARPSEFKVSVSEAQDIALDFVQKFYQESKPTTKSAESIKIESVDYVIDHQTTKSGDQAADTLMYAFNLSGGGFVLSASDSRTDPVYAFVEDGSYDKGEESEENPGFAIFLENAAQKMQKDIESYDESNLSDQLNTKVARGELDSDGFSVEYWMNPLLKTKWGQGSPYNTLTPIKNGKNCLTGCVITASAQIISYFKYPTSVKWGSSPVAFNWNNPSDTHIAILMSYLGKELNAEYDLDGTGANSEDARKWFSKHGYSVTKKVKMEAVQARRYLADGYLVYARGNAGYHHVGFIFRVPNEGHAWVIDGYLIAYKYNPKKRTSDTHDYLHCNWGWYGHRDGYYLATAFNTVKGSDFMDNTFEVEDENYYNFDYNLEMFGVKR